MNIAVQIGLLMLVLLGLGLWAVLSGLSAVRREREAGVTPQEVAKLAQPFRRTIAEAAALQREVAAEVSEAPRPLRRELEEIAKRISRLIAKAYPRALHGTRLLNQKNALEADDPVRQRLDEAIADVEAELVTFLETLKVLRGKVYRVLADAAALDREDQLARELEDAMLEVAALEEVFGRGEPSTS